MTLTDSSFTDSPWLMDPLAHWWLEIPASVQDQVWQQTQRYATPGDRWTAFLNQLCVTTLLSWLQSEYGWTAQVESDFQPWEQVWSVVTGTAIALASSASGRSQRWLLLPSASADVSEVVVPQEWVDLPGWCADYYLAVQVDPDEHWLRVWGYTSHANLCAAGTLDAAERVYRLPSEALIGDLSALSVMQAYAETTRAPVAAVAPLSAAQVEALCQQVGQQIGQPILEPRLALPWPQWAALLSQLQAQQQLGRLGQPVPERATAIAPEMVSELATGLATSLTNLSQWLQGQVSAGWRSLDTLLAPEANLAYSFRDAGTPTLFRRFKPVTLQNQSLQNQSLQNQSLQNQNFLLMVGLEPVGSEGDRLRIQVQLRPEVWEAQLPAGLNLSLWASPEEQIQQVATQGEETILQLQRFTIPLGTRFTIRVSLGETEIEEGFEA